jgi:hypothetical protein
MNARCRTYTAYSTGEIRPPAVCGAAGPAVQEALPG